MNRIRWLWLLLPLILWLHPHLTKAQQWLPGGVGNPIVCAYNSSLPTIGSGLFPYVQCDTHGQLLVSGGGGGGSFTGFTPTPSYASGTTSGSDQNVALPTGTEFILSNTGTQPLAWNIGAAATTTTNPLPANSWIAFAGTAAAAFHYIEGAGATGTTTFVISGGAGIPTGAGGGTLSAAAGNVFQATAFTQGTASSAATTQVFALVSGQTIYLVNYAYQTDNAATGAGTFQIVTGTGTNCSTINKTLTPVWNFAANAGIAEGSIGVLGASAASDEMCVVTTAAQKVNYRIGIVQQ